VKRFRLLIPLLLFAALAFVALNSKWYFEQFVAVKADQSVSLVFGFESFQTVEEIKDHLNAEKLKWTVKAADNFPEEASRPRFDNVVIRIEGFSADEFFGDLELRFNNDRLYQIDVFPSDLEAFVKTVNERYRVDLKSIKNIKTDKIISIEYLKDYLGKGYIRWSDEGIRKEVAEWIKRFS